MPFPPDLPPEWIAKASELGIDPKLIEEFHIRGTGHGGQKINRTSSTVQLVYKPYEIEIRCQEHREQSKNRVTAYQRLIEKVEEWQKDVERELAEHEYKEERGEGLPRRAKDKTIKQKKQRGEIKQMRRPLA